MGRCVGRCVGARVCACVESMRVCRVLHALCTHHNPSLNAQVGVLVEPDLHTRLVLQKSEDQILVEGERRGGG